jgi:predicted esterase
MKFSPVIDNNVNGFWEYLPRNYTIDLNEKYPLLIFFHGYGDSGSTPDSATLSKVLMAGTPRLIKNGQFPESFTVAGKTYRFLVISPQIKNGFDDATRSSNVAPSTVDAIIEYAKRTYRVDQNRIYICGLSMGGGIAWDYVGSSVAAASKVAAIGVAAGASDIDTTESNNIALSNLAVLATHNIVDNLIPFTRTVENVIKIKESKRKIREKKEKNLGQSAQDSTDVDPAAFLFATPGTGTLEPDPHNAWSRTFEDLQAGTTLGGNLRDSIGISVYEWLLAYDRSEQSTLPVAWESFSLQELDNLVVIKWATSMELNVSRFIVEKSRDGLNWMEMVTVAPRQDGGTLKMYSVADNSPYSDNSFYRVKQIDKDVRLLILP